MLSAELPADSRVMTGGDTSLGATLGLAHIEIGQNIPPTPQSAIMPLGPYPNTRGWVFISIALGGIVLTVYARFDDWKRGRR